jgi:hypothetical protein
MQFFKLKTEYECQVSGIANLSFLNEKLSQGLKLRAQNIAQYAEAKQPMGLVPWDI